MDISERLIFLDVETTGFNPHRDRIIEVFLLALDKSGGVEQYETLINPERSLSKKIVELTGITDEMLANAPREAEVAPQIREFIGHGTPVAHNLSFDRRFLNVMFKRHNLLQLSSAGLDTLAISRELFPRLCIYPEGGGSHRLSNLMYHFGLEDTHVNDHRAKNDVLLLVEVFRHLQAYANGTSKYRFPEAVTHGCPTCGLAMYLKFEQGQPVLTCQANSSCAKLVI